MPIPELVTALNAYADINTIQHRSLQLLCHHAKATVAHYI